MTTTLARNWWLLALRGILALLFGALAFIVPGLTIAVLVLGVGAYILIDGIFAVVAGIRAYGENAHWWASILEGIAGIIFGILTLVWPGISALLLLFFVAAWAVVTGAFEIAAAIRLRKAIENEWLLVLTGAASILFGILLVLMPGPASLALVWLIGSYAIVFGILQLILAFRVRRWSSRMEQPMSGAA